MGNKKLLGIKDLMAYLSLGKNKAREFGANSGAVVRIGGRVLYDREVIDKAVESARGKQKD